MANREYVLFLSAVVWHLLQCKVARSSSTADKHFLCKGVSSLSRVQNESAAEIRRVCSGEEGEAPKTTAAVAYEGYVTFNGGGLRSQWTEMIVHLGHFISQSGVAKGR
jgi:hypothetical protein